MTYRDLFKVMEKFGLLDLEVDNCQADCYPQDNDNYFVVVVEGDTHKSYKDITIKPLSGGIFLSEYELDPESDLGDHRLVSEKKLSLRDIKDWG